MPTTRVFMNGNSQAVRIPQEFRLDTTEVEIFKNFQGDLVLHPVATQRGTALLAALRGFDDEYATTLAAQQRDQQPTQDREAF